MSERNIKDSFWDDPEVRALKQTPRNLFAYLMMSPRGNIFGLYQIDFPTLWKHQSLTRQQAIDAFVELSVAGFVHYDLQREVVWVVNRARHIALSPSHWKGLRRLFASLYKSPLIGAFIRHYHRRTIGRPEKRFIAIDDKAAAELAELSGPSPGMPWDLWLRRTADPPAPKVPSSATVVTPQMDLLDTTTPLPYSTTPVNCWGQHHPSGRVVEVEVEVEVVADHESPEIPTPPDSLPAQARTRSTSSAKLAHGSGEYSLPPPPPAPSPPPNPPAADALALWSEQERLRQEIRSDGIDVHARSLGLVPSSHELRHVIARLADYGIERCRDVLACFEAEARAKKTLEFFNGVTNWRADQFQRMLASSPERETAKAHSCRGPRKRGNAIDWAFDRARKMAEAEASGDAVVVELFA